MRFLLTFLLTILFFNNYAQSVKKVETYYDPSSKTKIHEVYSVVTQPPYLKHGLYKEFTESGKLKREVNYVNGKRNGTTTNYYTLDGYYCKELPVFVENFRNDVLHGVQELYNCYDGKYQKIQRTEYNNGSAISEMTWYSNGTKKSQVVMNGLCGTWYENGKPNNEYTNLNGDASGAFKHWYENGQLASTGKYLNGNLIGEWTFYYEDGKIQTEKGFYADSRLRWVKNYDVNGNLKDELQSDSSKALVYVKTIYDTTNLKLVLAQYEQIMIDRSGNLELVNHGRYQKFFTNGELFQRGTYDLGNYSGKIEEYYPSGSKKIDATFHKGNKDGVWTYYDENGQITSTETFDNGIKVENQ
jgi:antitoxin component YwqK of YwqJK toxin-antitoxin module